LGLGGIGGYTLRGKLDSAANDNDNDEYTKSLRHEIATAIKNPGEYSKPYVIK